MKPILRALRALVVTPVLYAAGVAAFLALMAASLYAAWLLLGLVPDIDRNGHLARAALSGPVGGLVFAAAAATLQALWQSLRGGGTVTVEPLHEQEMPWGGRR